MLKTLSILKFFTIFIPFLLLTSSINSEERIGIAEKIVGNVYKKIIADKINAGDSLIYNQFVTFIYI